MKVDTAFTRYACACYVDPTGWHPRDSEPNGNTRDVNRTKLRTAIARASGVRDNDEEKRIVEKLKTAKQRGVKAADFDKMSIAKVTQKDETGKDVLVWSAAPGVCPLHNEPVILSMVADYEAPDFVEDELINKKL